MIDDERIIKLLKNEEVLYNSQLCLAFLINNYNEDNTMFQ